MTVIAPMAGGRPLGMILDRDRPPEGRGPGAPGSSGDSPGVQKPQNPQNPDDRSRDGDQRAIPGAGPAALSCLLLGEQPLVVHCADALRERGHHIVGIVTTSPAIKRWAEDHAVRVIEPNAYPEFLDGQAVDVLLSITHPALIKPENIAKARVAAFNYHDGPLPRYAGMNGSAWALLNGERRHAIVWHHLTAGLDEGDIVERRDLELDPRDTSVSVNMGNTALALESFRALILRIESRDLAGVPQRRDLERLIFSRHDRPPSMCVIDWTKSAAEIDRLVRACDFGEYANRFGSAKLVRGEHAVIVTEASPEGAQGDPGDAGDPGAAGSVLEIGNDGILVACRAGTIRLRGFTTLTGTPLSAPAVAERLGLVPGTRAPEWRLDSEAQSRKMAEGEPFFVSALSRRIPPSLPFETLAATETCSVDLALPAAFVRRFDGRLPDAVAALYAFTISCLIRDDAFDVAYVHDGLRRELGPALTLAFPSVPLRVAIDATQGFSALVAQFSERREQLSRRPAFLSDLIARHPRLRDQVDLRRGELSSVAILIDGTQLPPGAHLGLTIGGSACALVSDGHVERGRLAALAHQMGSVAVTVAGEPDRPLAGVDTLDDVQRQRQIFDWNATARPFPDTLRIHDLFEAQADKRPDAIALVYQGQSTSFGEVERQANRVANALQGRGLKPGDYVGLLVERGVDLVVAMLGIAKSGCAYVPIDAHSPQDRAHFMLQDAGCKAVLASADLVSICAGPQPVVLIDGPEITSASSARPSCPAVAADVCYAIYTSGSTGQPKGVVLSHRAVVNTLDWVSRTLRVGPSDRLLFVTSPSFDLSVYDIFGALGAGASVEIASTAMLREPADLARHLCEGGITIWDSAPPALARLASFFPERAPDSRLRLVMLSGDWIPVWLPDAMKRVFADVNVTSLGGATEAAIWSNFFEVAQVEPHWSSIPYGFPIQNARYHILDGHLRPVPVGIPGDLYIGGVCLAEGYLNRKELTAERFIADPFKVEAGQRLYKTGDLARTWDDGTMEFLGRADFQVKIRGFRVEMGEVEAAIRVLPGVRDAVCATTVDGSAQKSLVAYVVHRGDALLDGRAIKERLAAKLPDFMVPSHIVSLRAFPLSANGKVDRKALPSPSDEQASTIYRAPSSPTEQALAEIWRELLGRKSIGVDDNFFDLGGHSLLAVMLMPKLKQRFGVEIPLSRIIECPTIETLAACLDGLKQSPSSGARVVETGALIELRRGGPKSFFMVHDGDGETLLYRTLAQRMPEDFTVYGIPPRGLPRIPMADAHLSDMARSYLIEVRRRQPHGPYHLGGLCAGGVIAFEMASQLERDGEEVEIVVLLDAFPPTTRPRAGLISGARWRRLRAVFGGTPPAGQDAEPDPGLDIWPSIREAVRKARNVTHYEISARLQAISVALRFRLLHQILSRGWEWPSRVPPLTVRQIYLSAVPNHMPEIVRARHVVLVRASTGADADEPAIERFDDPLLGWGRFVLGQVEVVDVPGGHSSMLQEPNVTFLANRLTRYLAPSTNEQVEPARGLG